MIWLTNHISQSEWGIRLVNVFSFTKELSNEKTALNAVLVTTIFTSHNLLKRWIY
ncbi:hypothetical protein [Sulfurimonas sp.]|uniref:hypothetical protein n=1 Tax=Sulfurimonas sp. TaxID=2022749 RepID=UPI00263866A2|nr:hypothetical protein [Sulfurimonas sp.]